MHKSSEKSRLITQTIPKAWAELVEEPDELLLELLSEKVESMCGHQPELQILSDFIQATSNNKGKYSTPKTSNRVPTIHSPSKSSPNLNQATQPSTRKRGIVVKISDKTFSARSVSDLYSQVIKFLHNSGHLTNLRPYIPYATSRQRFLISIEPIHPRGNKFLSPVEFNGYFMEAHKSYNNAIKSLNKLLQLIDLSVVEVE